MAILLKMHLILIMNISISDFQKDFSNISKKFSKKIICVFYVVETGLKK